MSAQGASPAASRLPQSLQALIHFKACSPVPWPFPPAHRLLILLVHSSPLLLLLFSISFPYFLSVAIFPFLVDSPGKAQSATHGQSTTFSLCPGLSRSLWLFSLSCLQ
uniref:Uncharacterized protein n=1 Tax=Mus musculus TaxID=10090 RepID=Q9D2S2_MOUSE|nr:unnamed protein product [Mus musculus]